MSSANLKSSLISLGIYATVILLASLPIFAKPLTPVQAAELAMAAAGAVLTVALLRVIGIPGILKETGMGFLQAMLGIAIGCGLYSFMTPNARPEIMLFAYALWIAVGLPQLSSRGVLALTSVFLAAYLWMFTGDLIETASAEHSEALFMLIVSVPIAGFMYWRATQFHQVRVSRRLQDIALEDAESRIREITTQDAETTALKYAYFRSQLQKEKLLVDNEGGAFSVGLIEIDGFDVLKNRIGETATAQLLREFSERVTKLTRRMDTLGKWGQSYKPLGRISGGRFSLILPQTDFEGAMRCAERLHTAVDFQAIRTSIGVVGVTLSIGVTEYAKREGVDELMELAARALMLAQKHNGNDYRGLKRPQGGVTPTKEGLDAWSVQTAINR